MSTVFNLHQQSSCGLRCHLNEPQLAAPGGDSHIKRAGMLVVPPRFWYHLGCSKQNTYICIQHGTFKGCHSQLNDISYKDLLI